FLRQRLTAATSGASASQLGGRTGNASSINLRGLGADETLILVDGRRLAGFSVAGSLAQPDINGIPLSSVERIEVLPTSASGIYGGGATGGVINIILRRDYQGLEAKATYDGTFDGGGARKSIDLSGGFPLEGGKTRVMLSGAWSQSDPLLNG
ncbi:TonB-dependent receptor plug domain-containing protein, partial [Pseudomonas sp. JAI120]|uniref:TonB-dependent receptor plug domain-containing protein n=1 Tax=Pseudomonas sp. JAI120 TaxID=2723063 RepID=UPI0030EE27D2